MWWKTCAAARSIRELNDPAGGQLAHQAKSAPSTPADLLSRQCLPSDAATPDAPSILKNDARISSGRRFVVVSRELCAQGASFLLRVGSLMVLARLLEPKDFGLVGMVTAFTGVLTLFRDFGLSSAAVQRADRYRGTDFNIILDQYIAWSAAWAGSGCDGTGYRCLLPRATALWGDGCFGSGISFQRGRSTTLRTSPTPNAFYRPGGDKRRLLDCWYCHCHWWGKSGLRILVPCSDDGLTAPYCHYRFLADRGLGPGDATQAGWNSFYDAFWQHSHFEWPRGLCCL